MTTNRVPELAECTRIQDAAKEVHGAVEFEGQQHARPEPVGASADALRIREIGGSIPFRARHPMALVRVSHPSDRLWACRYRLSVPIQLTGADDGPHSFRLNAARLFGPPPVADVYLPLGGGLTAFYGLNGAGKSRILRGLAALLRGEPCDGGYLVASSGLRHLDVTSRDGFEGVLVAIARDQDLVYDDEDLDVDEGDEIHVAHIIDAILWFTLRFDDEAPMKPAPDWTREVARMVASQGLWILRASEATAGSWDVSPGFIVRDGDREIREWLSGSHRRVGADATEEDTQWASSLIEAFPLFSIGPLALALEEEHPARIGRAIDDVLAATVRPLELIAPEWNLTCSPQPLHLVDVLDNDLPPLDLLAERTDSLLRPASGTGSPAVAPSEAATYLSTVGTSISNRALPGGLTVRCVLETSADDGAPVVSWVAGTRARRDLELDDLSDAQRRWATRSIVLAIRQGERRAVREANEAQRLLDERARIEETRARLITLQARAVDSAAQAAAENAILRAAQEEHADAHAARVEWMKSLGYEPDVEEAEYDVEEMLGSEDAEEYFNAHMKMRLETVARADPQRAVAEHFQRFPQVPMVLLIDEPEAGLHRTAERGVVSLLRDIAAQQATPILVATHSPEFLRDRHVRSFVVERDEKQSVIIDDSFRLIGETAGLYGLSRLDVLHFYDTILLVEGRHDEIVLEAMLGEELHDLRALVVPLHGGRLLPDAADARILQDFTDHRIVAMVDNVNPEPFKRLLAVARQVTPGDCTAFDRAADEALEGLKADEVGFVRRLLRRAFEVGRLERYIPYALTKPDILEYLPPRPFRLDRSWEDLRAEFARQNKVKRFKRWLELSEGATFDDERVFEACRQMDSVPGDFLALLDLLARPSST